MAKDTKTVLLISGKMNSGKDTFAKHICGIHGAAQLSLAGKIKQFVKEVFDFPEKTLYGDSDFRSTRYMLSQEVKEDSAYRLKNLEADWCLESMKAMDRFKLKYPDLQKMQVDLDEWFYRECVVKDVVTARRLLQTLGTEVCRNWNTDFHAATLVQTVLDVDYDHFVVSDVRFESEVQFLFKQAKKHGFKVKLLPIRRETVVEDTHASEREFEYIAQMREVSQIVDNDKDVKNLIEIASWDWFEKRRAQ